MLPTLTFLVLLTHHVLPTSAMRHARRANNSDVLGFVDPLIGSQKGGNVFAGAVCTRKRLPDCPVPCMTSAPLTLEDFALWHGKR
jgi:hypothetical protein